MSNSTDNLSLAHTCWNCKYHVVFAPKYRRKEFYGLKRLEIGAILRTYGVSKVSELPVFKYEAFLTDVSQL